MTKPTLVFRMVPDGRCDGCGKLARTEMELGLCWECCKVYVEAFDRLQLLGERFSRIVWPCLERKVGQ